MTRRLGLAAAVLAAGLLSGCGAGSDVRAFVDDVYEEQSVVGDTATYLSPDAVAPTTSTIAEDVVPAARATDAGTEYLRYDEDIVIVSPAGGGSNVRVEDLDERFRSGAYAYLGSGFTPGSPAGDGGEEDVK